MEPQVSNQWPSHPYKGLQFYEAQDAPIFAGRETDISTCAGLIADDTARILILHGTTGCGKSSFLRAGLIPFLERHDFEFFKERARRQRALLIRCTDTPVRRLVEGIYRYVQSRSADGRVESALLDATSEQEYCLKASTEPKFFLKSLKKLGGARPRTLVFVIDQAEEVLTLNAQNPSGCEQFFEFIRTFIRSEYDLRIILTVRADYLSEFQGALASSDIETKGAHYFKLEEIRDEEKLAEVISKPTSTEVFPGYGAPREHYRFQFAPGLPEKIIDDIQSSRPSRREQSLLPVVQLYCRGLFEESNKHRVHPEVMTIDDSMYRTYRKKTYRDKEFLESLIAGHIDSSIRSFYSGTPQAVDETPEARPVLASTIKAAPTPFVTRWKKLLTSLADDQPAGGPATRLVSAHELRKEAEKLQCESNFEDMMRHLASDEQRILRAVEETDVGNGAPKTYLSLGHDMVGLGLEHWKHSEARKRERSIHILTIVGLCVGSITLGVAVYFGVNHIKPFFNRPDERTQHLANACTRRDQTSCGQLNLLVEKPCLKDSEPNACFYLAELEKQGLAKIQNLDNAMHHYEVACKGDIGRACYEAALIADSGIPLLSDTKLASYYYSKACEGPSTLGCSKLGLIKLSQDPRSPEARNLFERACSHGDALGCVQLGISLESDSEGYRTAPLWYQRGCEIGEAQACVRLGALYESGRFMPQNLARAVNLYQKACSFGDELQCQRAAMLSKQLTATPHKGTETP